MIETSISSVDQELSRLFADSRLRAGDYGADYVELWDRLEAASTGGKRSRPALVLTAYRGLGGNQLSAATSVAVAFELLHTAFVIHDDVIDRDDVRRGVPNVIGSFAARATASGANPRQARTQGEAAAVLAGDLALSHAHRVIARLDVPAAARDRLLDILERAVFISAAGELADVTQSISMRRLAVADVLATLERKTAVYSCEAPLQAGAVLAGASQDVVVALGRFGRLIGVAFQLTDDLLGVFGDEALTGKSATADLREGKQTTLIAHAATTPDWADIAPFIGKADLSEDEAEHVRAVLLRCGAFELTRKLAEDHVALALAEIEAADLPGDLVKALTQFTDRAVNRTR